MTTQTMTPIRRMSARLRGFVCETCGAVTIDWVVITAAIAGLGMAVTMLLSNSMATPANNLVKYLSSKEISTTF